MEISGINQLHSIMKPVARKADDIKPHEGQETFKKWLSDAIKKVNDAQVDSQIMTERFVRGDDVELHDVMISAQKASISLQTTVEVRNKVIEAYQEIMRMQV